MSERFSIRAVMAVIVVCAIGLAAVKNSGDLWAGMLLLASLFSGGYLAFAIRGCQRN